MKPGIILGMMALMICIVSCNSNQNNECSSDNPTEEIPWLKEIKQELEMSEKPSGFQIIRYKYKSEFVFYVDACYGCIDDIKKVYNCDGNIICEFGGYAGLNTCPDFEAEATDSTMLFNFVQP